MSVNRKGITLIELMLAVTITALVMLTVYPLIRQSYMVSSRSDVRNKAMTETRTGLELIINTLQGAKSGSWTISNVDPTHPASRIDFRRAKDNQAQSFYWSTPGLQFVDGSQQPKLIISHVAFVTFTGERSDPGTIYVSLHIRAPIPGSTPYTRHFANREIRLTE